MTARGRLAFEMIGLGLVILVAAVVFLQGGSADSGSALASPATGATTRPTAGSSTSAGLSPAPTSSAATSPSAPVGSPSSASSSTAAASPTASPSRRPTSRPTSPPRTSEDPHLAYADFLKRVNDDRAKVAQLNQALSAAVTAGDHEGARVAAVAILDFVDGERQWLLDNPAADCYADAHASGVAMLEAYQTAASLFVDWAASSGLDSLVALAKAADAASAAENALAAFGDEIGRTRCPT
jgi:hypothetical protein